MTDQPVPKKTSPWLYVGIGCLVAILLVVGGVALVGYLAVQKVKGMAEEMTDPKLRTAKVQKMLGATDFPAGYNPAFAFSMGSLVEMAMLSDKEPNAKGMIDGFDRHGFMYMQMMETQDKAKLRDYMDGKSDDPGMRSANVNMRSREVLKRGAFPINGEQLHYVAQRGDFNSNQISHHGITTMMVLDCPGDTKTRLAFWFGPDPDPEKKPKDLDLSGTPADEAAIKDFMGHFKPCSDG